MAQKIGRVNGQGNFFLQIVFKSIIRSTIWPNKWPSQLSSQLYDQKKSQVNCQVNYVTKKISSQLSSQLFGFIKINFLSIIVIFWLILVNQRYFWIILFLFFFGTFKGIFGENLVNYMSILK